MITKKLKKKVKRILSETKESNKLEMLSTTKATYDMKIKTKY